MYPFLQIGPITISTYFLVISLASTVGAVWFLRRNAREKLSQVVAIDFTLVAIVGGFVGARLLHVFYEDPEFYRDHFSRVFAVWNGGFVFLGGVLGGVGAAYAYCLMRKIPFLMMLDLAVIPLSFAYAIGRDACFLNGCCYGRHCDLPWAVTLNGVPRHPTQLYASGWEFLVLFALIKFESKLKSPGRLTGLWLILHSIGRIIMESFRDDPRGDMIASLSLATWLSFGMIVMGIGLIWPSRVAAEMHSQ
jgi:phosphatidylglycerol---prolipoprotein diacylglyceryl transferase